MAMRNLTWRSRRWLRNAAAILPIIAVGILVVSMTAAGGGGAPVKGAHDKSRSLASLLAPGVHASGKHTPGVHRAKGHDHPPAPGRDPLRGGQHEAGHRGGHAVSRVAPARDAALVPRSQVIANLAHATKGYPGRNSLMSNRQVPGSWYGHRSGLPVVAATPDRLLVRLAQRPNGATTWIKRDAAVLRVTHWAIVIDLSRHFLYAFYDGVQQYGFPVGTGTSRTPTPTGQFFVAFHAASNGPGYGPVNLATSAHSTVYSSFDGGDDAIIAIHGPIGSDSLIADHGAAISNGCIRMHLGHLAKVARHVPDGAPVIITR
jgi:lipoprotein-anchoring transpeptidase ErfK/SrfK